MNAKKCKQLRRLARALTVGLPQVRYLRHSPTGIIRADARTTRGAYLRLKREAALA